MFGNHQKDRNGIFLEAIDMVLEIWKRDGPYDLEGEHFSISTARTMIPRDRPGYRSSSLPAAPSADRRDRPSRRIRAA